MLGGAAQPRAALGCLTRRSDSGRSHCASALATRGRNTTVHSQTVSDKRIGDKRAPETARLEDKSV